DGTMTNSSGIRLWFPLDDQIGPASRISRTRASDIVAAAMGREAHSRIDLKSLPRRRPWRKMALLTAASLVLPVTVVAATVRLVAARHSASTALLAATQMAAPAPVEPKRPSRSGEGPALVLPNAPSIVEVA